MATPLKSEPRVNCPTLGDCMENYLLLSRLLVGMGLIQGVMKCSGTRNSSGRITQSIKIH